MISFQLLNQYLHTWGRALGAAFRPRTWTPFGALFLVYMALLALLYFGVRQPLATLWGALPDWIIPSSFFHYPNHLLYMPTLLYNRLMPLPGLLLESLLQGAATWIFVRHAMGQPLPGLGRATSEVKWAYGQLVLFWLLNFLLLRGFNEAFSWATGELWLGYAKRRMLVEFVQLGLGAAVNSILAFTTAVIVLERTSTLETLRRSVGTSFRHALSTWTTVFIGSLITWPFALILAKAPDWIGRFNPEVIVLVTICSVLAFLVASYLVIALLTFWYLQHRRAA